MHAKWLTKFSLRRLLRQGGCLQSKRHARAMLEAGHPLRCHEAHPPTMEDEIGGRDTRGERWFIKVPRATRRLMKSWQMTGRTRRSRKLRPQAARWAHQSAVGTHEVNTTMRNFNPVGIPGPQYWKGTRTINPGPDQKRDTV